MITGSQHLRFGSYMLPLYDFRADLTFIIAFVSVFCVHQNTVLEVKKLGTPIEEEIVGVSMTVILLFILYLSEVHQIHH